MKILLASTLIALSAVVSAQEPTVAPAEAAAPVTTETAEKTTVGVSLDASILLGAGLSVGTSVGDRFNVRGVFHGYSHDDTFEDGENNADYDATLRLQTLALMGDWHPFRGVFRITAGLVSNGNEIRLHAQDRGGSEYQVNDCTYVSSTSDPLQINGRVDFSSTVPYFGFGWGGNMNAEPGFYGIFDIGVLFSGSPNVELNARGRARAQSTTGSEGSVCAPDNTTEYPVNNFPEFQTQLDQAQADAEKEGEDYKLWPNIAFGFGWRF